MAFSYMRLPVIYLLVILFCTSCFDIKEEIYLKKDGSGRFRMLIDLSKHQEMLGQLVVDASAQDYPTFGEGEDPFQEMIDAWVAGTQLLNEIKGISGATAIVNKDAFVYGWEFDFVDINALNLVLALKDGGEFNTAYLPAYAFEKNLLTKHSVFSFYKLFNQLSENPADNIEESLKKQKKAIFAGIQYYCSLSVEGKIKKTSNKAYNISSDKKTVFYQTSLADIQSGKAYIGTKIKFK